jgi:hypothetical protein
MARTVNVVTGGVMGGRGAVRSDTAARNANLASRGARTLGDHRTALSAHEFARDMFAREVRNYSPGGLYYHPMNAASNARGVKRGNAGVTRHDKAIEHHRGVIQRTEAKVAHRNSMAAAYAATAGVRRGPSGVDHPGRAASPAASSGGNSPNG